MFVLRPSAALIASSCTHAADDAALYSLRRAWACYLCLLLKHTPRTPIILQLGEGGFTLGGGENFRFSNFNCVKESKTIADTYGSKQIYVLAAPGVQCMEGMNARCKVAFEKAFYVFVITIYLGALERG